jgi:DNA-binding transcriptional regulator YiaG
VSCSECGGEKHEASAPADVPFPEFPGAILVGISASRCATCGAAAVEIPDRPGLLRSLADLAVRKTDRSTPQELRFFREHALRWTPKTFARRLGVNDGNAWKWERGQKVISETADKLVRLLVVQQLGIQDFPLDLLDGVAAREGSPLALRLVFHGGQWTEPPVLAAEPSLAERDWPLVPHIQASLAPTLAVVPGDEPHTYIIGRRSEVAPREVESGEPLLTIGRREWRMTVGGSVLKSGPLAIRLDGTENPRSRGAAVVQILERAGVIASVPRRPKSGKNATNEEVKALLDLGLQRAGSWTSLARALGREATSLRVAYEGRRSPHRTTFERWTAVIARLGEVAPSVPEKKPRGKRVAAFAEGPQRVTHLNAILPDGYIAELAADGERIRLGRAGADGVDGRHPMIELHRARWSVQIPGAPAREGWHKKPHGLPEVYVAEALRIAAAEGVVPSDKPLRGRRARPSDTVDVEIVRAFLDGVHQLAGTWPEAAEAMRLSLPVIHACRQGRRPVSAKEITRWRRSVGKRYRAEPATGT